MYSPTNQVSRHLTIIIIQNNFTIKKIMNLFVIIFLSLSSFGSTNKAWWWESDFDSAMKLKSKKERSMRFTRLLGECKQWNDQRAAWEIFSKMQHPDVFHYNNMIHIFKWKPNKVAWLLDDMHKRGVQSNFITYSTVLNAFKHDHSEFQKFWNEMKEDGIEPNLITYSTALNAFKDDHSQFLKFWDEMKEDGIEPDLITYSTALNVFKDHHSQFLKFWYKMEKDGIKPDLITYSIALNAFKDDHSQFLKFWHEMRKKESNLISSRVKLLSTVSRTTIHNF